MDKQSTSEKREEDRSGSESLVATFHRVQSLIPDVEKLMTIPPEMPVAEALELMRQHHFSQLPVVAGDAVLGVFSYRSFSAKALARQKSAKQSLGELPVEDFLEDFEYVHANEDWNHVLRYLDQNDAFLVGHRNALEGMVTTSDLLRYLQEIANPFVLIAEIELSLRQIIQTCIDAEALPDAITRSLKTAYPADQIPTDLNEMTFDNYVQIISNGENWSYFKAMFGSQTGMRKETNHKLQQLGQWRNTIFHFRRRLKMWELETLVEHREWLHRRVRAFEGRRRKAAAQRKAKAKTQLTRGKWDEVSFFAELESRQGVKDVAAAQEILAWAQKRMTRVWWGEGKRSGSFVPILHHNGQDHQLFAVWTSGGVEIYFYWYQRKPPFSAEEKRLELLKRLNTLSGVSIPRDGITKRPSFPLSVLGDKTSRQQFLAIFDWVVQEIQSEEGYGSSATTQSGSPGLSLTKPQLVRWTFLQQLLNRAKEKTDLFARVSPNKDGWIAAGAGRSGLGYVCGIRKRDAQVELSIDTPAPAENKRLLDKLLVHQEEIEKSFGESLIWYHAKDVKRCAVRYVLPGGGLANQDQWPDIQDKMIDAIIRLEKALEGHVQKL